MAGPRRLQPEQRRGRSGRWPGALRRGRPRSSSSYWRIFRPLTCGAWAADLGISTFVGHQRGACSPKANTSPPTCCAPGCSRLRRAGRGNPRAPPLAGLRGRGGGAVLRDETTGREFTLEPAATVLALGGASWPQTGSDGPGRRSCEK
ncbi:MAG: hypothetical protein WKG07_41195 [Hymenobacter sp.]